MKKTILITGASSGIGKATAKLFNDKGWNVIATMRSPQQEKELLPSDTMLLTTLDVQNPESIKNAVALGIQRFGKIDLLVNNAGYGQYGIFEALTPEHIQKQFDVNVFGVMNVIRAVLPHMREQKGGTIINISSGGGRFAMPLTAIYNTSKFAIEGFTESLSYELHSQNIKVKIIEPGGVSTNFNKTSDAEFATNSALTDYNDFLAAASKIFAEWKGVLSTPAEVAGVVYEAATDGTDILRYSIGEDIKPLLQARISMSDQEYITFMRKTLMPGMY